MKIKFTPSFQNRLLSQIKYIARDSPTRARKFHRDLLQQINSVPHKPFSFRKSIYFDDNSVRDLVYKGYTIVFIIQDDSIVIFGFVKYQKSIESK